MHGYHTRPVVSLIVTLLVGAILACAIGPPDAEEEVSLARTPIVSEADASITFEAIPTEPAPQATLAQAETAAAAPTEPGRGAEEPTSTPPRPPAGPTIDKWSLWVDGPHLRGANIYWLYLIDVNLEPEMVARIAASEYDMVVLDFIPSEGNNTDYPMVEVVDQLHNALHPKLVMAYIDIGQAEEYRTYWQPGWGVGGPEWIVGADPDGWEGNFPVAYWYDEWQEIWLGEEGHLSAILDAGFDGVYLDWVEAYSDENVVTFAEEDEVDPRQEMIWWVEDIANFTRAQRPDFVVIAQNAAELAEDEEYLRYLTTARDKGEIIFTVDYASEPENVSWVYQTSRALGFVPFVGNRALDRYVEPVP
jgi:endo-alpha-1,4-polygalactosaminidase (GH114 family)